MIDLLLPATADEPEAVARARSFFYGEGGLVSGLPDDVALALVETLLAQGDGEKLATLAAANDKALAKRARKAIHVLKSRGVTVAVPQKAARVIGVASAPEPEPVSLASTIVRDGEQIVWLARSTAEGGVNVYQAQIRDSLGLVELDTMRASRKQWRGVMQELIADPQLVVAPTDAAHARWLIEGGAQRSLALGRQPPRSYSEARVAMGAVTTPTAHPVEQHVSAERIAEAARAPERFVRVLETPEGFRCIPPEDLLEKAARQLDEIAASTVIADEVQRAEQVREAIARASREALAGPWRGRLAHQLRETALVVARRAEVGARGRDYAGDAALFAAAALQLEDARAAVEELALAHRMFERVLTGALAASPLKK